MAFMVQKVLVVVVVISTLCVLATVLGLVWTMPDLPKSVITDEICLPDQSGNLICGKTEERLYDYTNAVSGLHVCIIAVFGQFSGKSIYSLVNFAGIG